MNNSWRSKFHHLIINHKYLLLLISILLGMSVVLYGKYVFGGKLFLFEDFGSDSVRVSLPTYIYLFDWFRNGMPLWSDKMGIGTSILSHSEIILDPFTYILFLLGRNGIIYMFVYMVIVKIILAGMFFWMFLGRYKLSVYAKLIGATTYAFGGYMIVVGQNYVFGTIYVYLPLILLGFEMWLQDKKKWLLILILTLTCLYFYYLFYMTAVFFGTYALFRYFSIYDFNLKHFLKYISSLALYGITAMGLSAFYWLPSLAVALNNLRVGISSVSIESIFIPNSRQVLTVLGRILGYDTFGSISSYIGYGLDYFQLALFCGVITVVLIPQLFFELDRRKRKIYTIFFVILLAFLLIPFFTYVFNAFSDFNYRWVYVINFSLALLLSFAVELIFKKNRINFKFFFLTICTLFLISLIVMTYNRNIVTIKDSLYSSFKIFFKDYIFISAYLILIILFFRTEFKKIIKIIIFVLVCIELIWFPYRFINDRLTTFPNPVANKLGYFDNTDQVIRYLTKNDSSIYRLDKSYDSVISEFGVIPSDNDALVQGYRGLKSYNSNNQPNYIRFLQNAGIFIKYPNFVPSKNMNPLNIKDPNLNYINGVGNRYILQTFLGVKYYLTKKDSKIALPDYYRYVTTIKDVNIYQNNYFLPLGFSFDSYITNDEFAKLSNSEKDLALLSFIVADNRNELSGIISKNNTRVLSDITSDADISDVIRERRRNHLKIISYEEDHIVGQISDSKNKILVLTVPYDQGWTVSVDNHKIAPFKVDNGLIGVKLSSGSHIIELKYFPPKMILGIIISIITLFLLVFSIRYKLVVLRVKSLINKQSMILYNNYVSKPFDELTKRIVSQFMKYRKPILRNLSIFSELSRLSLKKLIFYLTTLISILAFISTGFITRGYSFYNFFNPDKNDSYMDFFNVLRNLFDGPYTHDSIYPPLPLLMYRLLLRLIPYDIAGKDPHVIRAAQSGEIVFLFYMLITLFIFFILLIEIKKGLLIEKYIFTFVILLSAPFLFQFERANIVFVVLLLLMIFVFFKDSRNRIVKEIAIISLAISIGFKIYPFIFIFLLFKERRYKDVLSVFIYSLIFLVVPFFAVGGITQIPLFLKNVLFTSNYVTGYGLGYMVNIQNMVRILFGFFGDFSNSPIFIGNILTIITLFSGIFSIFFLHSKWKTIALITLLMITIPTISYEYTLIFMLIPLIMFLDQEKKEKLDYLYLTCFILILIPFSLGKIESINIAFKENSHLPLTYGIVIQNIAISLMVISLIIQGLKMKLSNILNYIKIFLQNIRLGT